MPFNRREVVITKDPLERVCAMNSWDKSKFTLMREIEQTIGGRGVAMPMSQMKIKLKEEVEDLIHHMHANLATDYYLYFDKRNKTVTATAKVYRYSDVTQLEAARGLAREEQGTNK